MPLGELKQDENGAPLPSDDVYWSITHKTQYVGGVVAPAPIGIDIERIRECAPGLFAKTAGEREWALADEDKEPLLTFFRYWTIQRGPGEDLRVWFERPFEMSGYPNPR